MFRKILAVLFILLLPMAARADDGPFSGGIKLGTLGIGPEVGYRPISEFGIRADAAFFGFDDNFTSSGVRYDGNIHLESYGLTGDWYPFAASFRLSAGLRLNENNVNIHTDPTQTVTVGGINVAAGSPAGLNGKLTFDKFSPYAGIGWSTDLLAHLALTSDIGVMFQGNPKAQLYGTGLAAAPGISNAVQSERASIQNDVNGYDFYPVLQIGLVYKF